MSFVTEEMGDRTFFLLKSKQNCWLSHNSFFFFPSLASMGFCGLSQMVLDSEMKMTCTMRGLEMELGG